MQKVECTEHIFLWSFSETQVLVVLTIGAIHLPHDNIQDLEVGKTPFFITPVVVLQQQNSVRMTYLTRLGEHFS